MVIRNVVDEFCAILNRIRLTRTTCLHSLLKGLTMHWGDRYFLPSPPSQWPRMDILLRIHRTRCIDPNSPGVCHHHPCSGHPWDNARYRSHRPLPISNALSPPEFEPLLFQHETLTTHLFFPCLLPIVVRPSFLNPRDHLSVNILARFSNAGLTIHRHCEPLSINTQGHFTVLFLLEKENYC